MFVKMMKEVAEYVECTYKYGSDVRLAIKNLAMPILDEPNDPKATATKTQLCIWEKNFDEYVKHITGIKENLKTIYSLVWGQCTDIMHQKVEALDDHSKMSSEGDGMGLLRAIKDLVFNFQSQK